MGKRVLLSQSYEISRQTAHYFMQKVREAMKSSELHKMNDKRIVERSPVSQS